MSLEDHTPHQQPERTPGVLTALALGLIVIGTYVAIRHPEPQRKPDLFTLPPPAFETRYDRDHCIPLSHPDANRKGSYTLDKVVTENK